MASLTPLKDADATVWAAMKEGFIGGGLAAIPSSLAVYAAMKFSPKFVKSTNWQSRTALVIMPPLFAFAFSAEQKLVHSMHDMASRANHSKQMAEWSQEHALAEHKKALKRMATQKILSQPGMSGMESNVTPSNGVDEDHEKNVKAKFRESVVNSGVRVVPGDSLGVHHKIANFWQENPFKILAAIGVPTVLYIFKGREGQQHLQTQMKIMHTRVFGQFAVITMLLTLMGFKEYMDRSGKFITEEDVQSRVAEMQQSRAELMMRLQRDRMEAEKVAEKRRKAHAADVLKSSEVKNLLKDA
mmetsp:Transcript_42456/g.90332  ORF Transcript_42456/g.90332 Transcript_42456/m.90332 type:complete len:300 (+) Transcript_42456:123-1022(+)|eukprot:CAMPEP_0172544664 /NCGR_PEP_ID=MMETSP1067-20121228/14760_1 /TAXON_ID=265564 ORGANISM="Thalassiosira punctigera, Strain Tpunct2005C2" /NCGR_SAMPLE_ID=MMETSP1067 /ASSEMBLY_ACC=CAM_ASM_000444 /LENGTH=299 /DNA_ID=CAMNT_0013331257 /DNA_START=123 /DNA_END=1022 /DNA_ORIENTATION=-